MGVKNLQVSRDSRLVANQVPRSENKKADALSKIASTSFAHLTKQVLVEELSEKSINIAEVLAVVEEEGDTWMTQIYNYLMEETLHAEKEKARAVHRPVLRNPQQKLTPITSLWPFYKWGIDIAGPFPEGPGEIISDNEKQFRDNPFKDWCEKLCIGQRFASVKHPQANGLVERENRSLGEGIKARHGRDMVQNDEALEIKLDLLGRKDRTGSDRDGKIAKKNRKILQLKRSSANKHQAKKTSYHLRNDASRVEDGGKLGP
ncbi:reverse transcriptase domain-containing protein [Tanacetum coccineum]